MSGTSLILQVLCVLEIKFWRMRVTTYTTMYTSLILHVLCGAQKNYYYDYAYYCNNHYYSCLYLLQLCCNWLCYLSVVLAQVCTCAVLHFLPWSLAYPHAGVALKPVLLARVPLAMLGMDKALPVLQVWPPLAILAMDKLRPILQVWAPLALPTMDQALLILYRSTAPKTQGIP